MHMRCEFTSHAIEKLELIGIEMEVVERIVKTPKIARYSSQNKDVLEYYGTFDSRHSLKVVLVKSGDLHRIITVILQKSSRDPTISNYIQNEP